MGVTIDLLATEIDGSDVPEAKEGEFERLAAVLHDGWPALGDFERAVDELAERFPQARMRCLTSMEGSLEIVIVEGGEVRRVGVAYSTSEDAFRPFDDPSARFCVEDTGVMLRFPTVERCVDEWYDSRFELMEQARAAAQAEPGRDQEMFVRVLDVPWRLRVAGGDVELSRLFPMTRDEAHRAFITEHFAPVVNEAEQREQEEARSRARAKETPEQQQARIDDGVRRVADELMSGANTVFTRKMDLYDGLGSAPVGLADDLLFRGLLVEQHHLVAKVIHDVIRGRKSAAARAGALLLAIEASEPVALALLDEVDVGTLHGKLTSALRELDKADLGAALYEQLSATFGDELALQDREAKAQRRRDRERQEREARKALDAERAAQLTTLEGDALKEAVAIFLDSPVDALEAYRLAEAQLDRFTPTGELRSRMFHGEDEDAPRPALLGGPYAAVHPIPAWGGVIAVPLDEAGDEQDPVWIAMDVDDREASAVVTSHFVAKRGVLHIDDNNRAAVTLSDVGYTGGRAYTIKAKKKRNGIELKRARPRKLDRVDFACLAADRLFVFEKKKGTTCIGGAGKQLWAREDISASRAFAPQGGGHVALHSYNEVTWVEADTGETAWTLERHLREPLVFTEDHLWAVGDGEALVGVRLDSGVVEHEVPLPGYNAIHLSGLVVDGAEVHVVNKHGNQLMARYYRRTATHPRHRWIVDTAASPPVAAYEEGQPSLLATPTLSFDQGDLLLWRYGLTWRGEAEPDADYRMLQVVDGRRLGPGTALVVTEASFDAGDRLHHWLVPVPPRQGEPAADPT